MSGSAARHFASAKRHQCSKCGTHMFLFGSEPDRGFQLHSFECAKCKHIEAVHEAVDGSLEPVRLH